MKYKYAIIKGSEDGDPICYLDDNESNNVNINQLMEDYGITTWVEKYDDPNYWPEGEGMLVKIQCINPEPIKVVTDWKIPE